MEENTFCLRINQITLPEPLRQHVVNVKLLIQEIGFSTNFAFTELRKFPGCLRSPIAPEFSFKYHNLDENFVVTVLLQTQKNGKKQTFCGCEINGTWFQPNRVVRECFPMTLIEKPEKNDSVDNLTPLIFVEIHLNENGSKEFCAPLGLMKEQYDMMQKSLSESNLANLRLNEEMTEEESEYDDDSNELFFDSPKRETNNDQKEIIPSMDMHETANQFFEKQKIQIQQKQIEQNRRTEKISQIPDSDDENQPPPLPEVAHNVDATKEKENSVKEIWQQLDQEEENDQNPISQPHEEQVQYHSFNSQNPISQPQELHFDQNNSHEQFSNDLPKEINQTDQIKEQEDLSDLPDQIPQTNFVDEYQAEEEDEEEETIQQEQVLDSHVQEPAQVPQSPEPIILNQIPQSSPGHQQIGPLSPQQVPPSQNFNPNPPQFAQQIPVTPKQEPPVSPQPAQMNSSSILPEQHKLSPAQPIPPQPAPLMSSGRNLPQQIDPNKEATTDSITDIRILKRQYLEEQKRLQQNELEKQRQKEFEAVPKQPQRKLQYFFPTEQQIQTYYVPPKPLTIPLYNK